jgi:transposase
MGRVVIGMDPHKASATIEVLDERERVLHCGQYGTDRDGYRQMLAAVRGFERRLWAVEGSRGTGRHLAQRLVADGETVVDVPAKLAARVRVFDTGNGRKTDAADAHSVAVVALRTKDLVAVGVDDDVAVLRLLSDRHDELSLARTQTVNRLHRLLLELIPGGAKRWLSAIQAARLVADIAPTAPAGQIRHRLAGELVGEIAALDGKLKASEKQLHKAVLATGTGLLDLYGIGPVTAARLLGDVLDITRFTSRARFASWNGTAPLDASSGEQKRHRLSRAGNRRINRVLHIMAIVQIRFDTDGRAYYQRRLAAGKTPREAIRCLKRRLSDVVYRQLIADAAKASPGGHSGATTTSSAADLNPTVDSSDKPLPGLDHEATPPPAATRRRKQQAQPTRARPTPRSKTRA